MTLRERYPSAWLDSARAVTFPQLQGDLLVDVAVVGAGITGLTTALLLSRAGLKVGVVEAGRVAGDVSGHTTAHLTAAIDTRYSELTRTFGTRGAQLAAQSSMAAIAQIARFVDELQLECDFARVPGYLYTESPSDVAELEDELQAARRAGLDVAWANDVPLPFQSQGAVLFREQAQFNPVPYLQGLAHAVVNSQSAVFEDSRVVQIDNLVEGQLPLVRTAHGSLRARALILATHAPIHDPSFLQDLLLIQSKLSPYRSYVIAARLREQNLPVGLFWDTEDPYHYIRSANTAAGPLLIVGGEDHRSGEETDTETNYAQLEQYLREHFAVDSILYRWSSQWYEPADGLPYIGKTPLPSPVWVATGYSGNGMTFGTIAGMVLADEVLGRPNPWSDLYAANRVKPLATAGSLLAEGAKIVEHFVGDRLDRPSVEGLAGIEREQGRVLQLDGEQVAVYRDAQGELHAMSAVCTHAKCIVGWNSAEKSWDCPCHGGRYSASGEVLNGPPVKNLEPLRLVE